MAGNKNYANGVFAKEFEAQFGLMISLGIRRDDFIAWLDSLEENDKGYINLTMGPNKEAPGWSMWENNYQPEAKQTRPAARTTGRTGTKSDHAKPAARTATKAASTRRRVGPVDDGESELPF